jgi:hypothetical protein
VREIFAMNQPARTVKIGTYVPNLMETAAGILEVRRVPALLTGPRNCYTKSDRMEQDRVAVTGLPSV